jgi:molybdopterin-guanine dinucleotide biosynthesis protein A
MGPPDVAGTAGGAQTPRVIGGAAFDAIVVAGGAGRRLGGVDKPMVAVGGVPMLVRVLAAVRHADRRVVVGPVREGLTGVLWTREEPPGGGPVAAVAAGARKVAADVVVVLAADLPWIGDGVAALIDGLAAHPECDAAMLETDGRGNPLAASWRRETLTAVLDALPVVSGMAMMTLYRAVTVHTVVDRMGWGVDCDTWADLERAQ